MDDFNRIIKLENEIDLIKRKLKQNEKEKTRLEIKLEDYMKELNAIKFSYDDLCAGSKLKFKDEDDNIYEFIVVVNDDMFNVILMSDNSDVYEYFKPYYCFDYRCIYIDTLIASLTNEYNLELIDTEI